jgi:23S rRNA pseudouridine2604 synthase
LTEFPVPSQVVLCNTIAKGKNLRSIVNKILRAGNNNEKEYVVTVDKELTPEMIRQMGAGVRILGEKTKP